MAKGSKSHQYNTWWIKTPTKTEQKNHSFSEELKHLIYNTTLHCYRWLVNANISNWETYVVDVGFEAIKDLFKKKISSQLSVGSDTFGRGRWNYFCARTRLPAVFNESYGYHFVRYVISN